MTDSSDLVTANTGVEPHAHDADAPADGVATQIEAAAPSEDSADQPKKRPFRAMSPQDQLKLAEKAKSDFARMYHGTQLTMDTTLWNDATASALRRYYDVIQRNWFNGTTQLRTQLKDPAAATAFERAILDEIAKLITRYENEAERLAHVMNDSEFGEEALKNVTAQNPRVVKLPMVGPVSFKYRLLLLAVDKVLTRSMAAYTTGVLDATEHDNIRYKAKNALKQIDSLARNLYRQALQKMNAAGISRPGYQPPAPADSANSEAAAEATSPALSEVLKAA